MVLEEKQVGPMCECYFQAKLAMLGRLLQGWVALGQDLPITHAELYLASLLSCCCLSRPVSLLFLAYLTGSLALARWLALCHASLPWPFVSLPTAYGGLRLREVTTLP